MTTKRFWVLPALFLTLCIAARAQAGSITFVINASVSATGNSADADINLKNVGDDSARKVEVAGTLAGQTQTAKVADAIEPRESASTKLSFTLPEGANGTYPVYIQLSYEDTNGAQAVAASLGSCRTSNEVPASTAVMAVARSGDRNQTRYQVTLNSVEQGVSEALVTCFVPDDLTAKPKEQRVALKNGAGQATFTVSNRGGREGSQYGLFFVATYDLQGEHYTATADSNFQVVVTKEPIRWNWTLKKGWLIWGGAGLVLIAALLTICLLSRKVSEFFVQGLPSRNWLRTILDCIALLGVIVFIIAQLHPETLITDTITAGGDTGSHFYTVKYLHDVLLPKWEVNGWTFGNYAGFPMLQMYFPLGFLTMCLLNIGNLIPLTVAFKFVTLGGTVLMPIGAYVLLRNTKTPWPGPIIGAAMTMLFLFNGANSMWGGNLLSTFAGEFSYSLSMALSLFLIGSLYSGALSNRRVVLNGILVFLVGFSHGYTLLFTEGMSVFLLLTPRGLTQRVVYLGKVYALGFCLLAFWLVPLLAFTKYSTPYHLAWTITEDLFPNILMPMMILAAAGSVGLLVGGILAWRQGGSKMMHSLGYLWFGITLGLVMYCAAPKLGVVDIRYIPYMYLLGCMVAGMALGWLGWALRRWAMDWAVGLIGVSAVMLWTSGLIGAAPGWAQWNYSGYEAKGPWKLFKSINDTLKGTFQDPRVVFEHSEGHNQFGTSRAFESLPLFAGRATLEGLYMQASPSAPFVFYIQSEITTKPSCPFPQYSYSNVNFARAAKHLAMFNVRDLILVSPEAKAAAHALPNDYALKKSFDGGYEWWQLTTNKNRYVEPMIYEPVLYETRDWKRVAHKWFTTDNFLDIPLVFGPDIGGPDRMRFRASAGSLKTLPNIPIDTKDCKIKETIHNESIDIETNWLNKPLLIKVSYHPNWHVEGADKIYLVSPSFMMIYPTSEKVRLWYGPSAPGRFGEVLTTLGILILLLSIPLHGTPRRSTWTLIAAKIGVPASLEPKIALNPSDKTRWTLLIGVICAGAIAAAALSVFIYYNEPVRVYIRAERLKDVARGLMEAANKSGLSDSEKLQKREASRRVFEQSIAGFRQVWDAIPDTDSGQRAAYFTAICCYLQEDYPAAIAAFQKLIAMYPNSPRLSEAYYHIGICQFRLNQNDAGIDTMRFVRDTFPGNEYAKYAAERLVEHKAMTAPALPDKVEPPGASEDTGHIMGRGVAMFNQDRYNEAQDLFLEVIKRPSEGRLHPQALACLALIRFKQGDWAGTVKYYSQLVEGFPNDQLACEAWFHIGVASDSLGDKVKAKEAWEKAAEKDPNSIYAKYAKEKLDALK